MIMAQNEYEKIVKAMADKGVPHLFFELLADLRKNEINNSKAIDGIEFAVATALNGCKDFENNDAHESNYLQVIRKLASDYKRAIDEIAEIHSSEEEEIDGTMCFAVSCGCEQWKSLMSNNFQRRKQMSGYAKDIKGVLEDCERALQFIEACVAYDGTIRSLNTTNTAIRSALRKLFLRLRERVSRLKQDGYCCQGCGIKQSRAKGREVYVEVHHKENILNWPELFDAVREHLLCDPEKVETLCRSCHKKHTEMEKTNRENNHGSKQSNVLGDVLELERNNGRCCMRNGQKFMQKGGESSGR